MNSLKRFWRKTKNKMSLRDLEKKFKTKGMSARSLSYEGTFKYAFDRYPNLGPGGAYCEKDNRFFDSMTDDEFDEYDPEPSLDPAKVPLAYNSVTDELYCWGNDDGWIMWNY